MQTFKLTKDQIAPVLNRRGFRLLSTYLGVGARHEFQCEKCNHVWSTHFSNVWHNGSGCPKCAGQAPLAFETLKRRIELEFPNVVIQSRCPDSKLLNALCSWCGLTWTMNPKNKERCRNCRKFHKITAALVTERIHAVNPAIRLLEVDPINTQTPLRLNCTACGFEWVRSWYRLRGSPGYCPGKCFRGPKRCGLREREVRNLLEKITGWSFPKTYPIWLRGRLKFSYQSLDGLNLEHSVAFEFQGAQHYKPVAYWGGLPGLVANKRRDAKKRMACKRNGVFLICVPFWKKDVAKFLRTKLSSAGYCFPEATSGNL